MNKVYVTAIVKDVPAEEYGRYLSPMKARRMGKLQKRALVTALKAMEISGIGEPDAILNGTAMGCMENTVQMLNGLSAEGEEVNMPTCFMQSTHNTVSSSFAHTSAVRASPARSRRKASCKANSKEMVRWAYVVL